MRLASLTLPFLAVAALAAACTKTNPDFCGSDPCPPDAPPAIDGMTGCTANPGICTGEASTCLNDECVDCGTAANQESADCTATGLPVCGADHACRACAADSECTSGVCESGTCNAAAVAPFWSKKPTSAMGSVCTPVPVGVFIGPTIDCRCSQLPSTSTSVLTLP